MTEKESDLIIATGNGNLKAVEALLKSSLFSKGVNTEVTNDWGDTPLSIAAEKGFTDIVALLLKKKANINFQGHQEYSALMKAALGNHPEIVKILIDNGAAIDLENYRGCTALQTAFYLHVANRSLDRKEIIELLLSAGANPNVLTDDGDSLLNGALRNDVMDIALLLINAGADVNAIAGKTTFTDNYKSPLLKAVNKGNYDIVKLLVEKGADVNYHDNNSIYANTPLYIAAENGFTEISELLIKKGANVNGTPKPTYSGDTPLIAAIEKEHHAIIDLLLRNNVNINGKNPGNKECSTPLIEAIRIKNNALILTLIEKGADVSLKGSGDLTPLHKAAENGLTDIVAVLIDRGADINAVYSPEYQGYTALYFAINGNHSDIAIMLIEKGADIDINLVEKWHLLELTIQNNMYPISKLLIEKGVNVNAKNYKEEPILLQTVKTNHPFNRELLNLLFEHGVDIDSFSSFIPTALHEAVSLHKNDYTQWLLEKKANVNAQDMFGQTPLMRAIIGKYSDTAQLLIDAGANVNLKSSASKTALDFADGSEELIRMLVSAGAQKAESIAD